MSEELEQVVPSEKQEYIPSRSEVLREYDVRIKFLDRGCIVSVGCKEIAFESVDFAMVEINKYVANPYEVQKKWREILK
jgi:hypothetical protein